MCTEILTNTHTFTGTLKHTHTYTYEKFLFIFQCIPSSNENHVSLYFACLLFFKAEFLQKGKVCIIFFFWKNTISIIISNSKCSLLLSCMSTFSSKSGTVWAHFWTGETFSKFEVRDWDFLWNLVWNCNSSFKLYLHKTNALFSNLFKKIKELESHNLERKHII